MSNGKLEGVCKNQDLGCNCALILRSTATDPRLFQPRPKVNPERMAIYRGVFGGGGAFAFVPLCI